MTHPSVWYFAHPVGPPCACEREPTGWVSTPADAVACNVARAKRWLRWCWERAPQVSIIAPWLPHVELLGNEGPHRERGLRDNCAAAARCDGIILAGGKVTTGMGRERDTIMLRDWPGCSSPAYDRVLDLSPLGPEPPMPGGCPASDPFIERLRSLR